MARAPDPSARLHRWIARASLPEERLDCAAFTLCARQDEVVLADRRASWDALFERADPAVPDKADILAGRGLGEAQWARAFGDVEVTAPQHLPNWATTFAELYRHWRHDHRGEPLSAPRPADKPYPLLTAVWGELCRPWVEAQRASLADAGIELGEAAVDDLLAYAAERTTTPVFATLSAYPGALPGDYAAQPSVFETLDFWQDAFDRQPILVHIIGNLVWHWQAASAEMLARFADDLAQLRQPDGGLLAGGDGAIVIHRLPCGLGDPHRGGRSVAIFETDHGAVVYKPKDLAGTRATGLLLRELHELRPDFVPLAPDFLYRRGYGWEQRVSARECATMAEVETFYRRLGGWLFLIQLLNGNDFWYDNLIACADMPYFIDYETIIGNNFPVFGGAGGGGATGAGAGEYNEHIAQFYTMVMSGILPLLMPGSTDFSLADGIDISVLAPPGKQRVPFAHPGKFGGGNNGGGDDGDDEHPFSSWEASDYAPFHRGEYQDINPHFDIFLDGYQQMGKLLLEAGPGHDALRRFRRRTAKARFRQILIDTWQCYSLLWQFFAACRTDGVRAAIARDQLLVRFRHFPRRVTEGIRHDLWRNDVPLFELQTDNRRVYNTAGEPTEEDFFSESADDKISRNLVYLAAEMERQIAHIKALFAARPDSPRRNWRRAPATETAAAATVGREELLPLAEEIGAQLAAWVNQPGELHERLAFGRLELNDVRVPQSLSVDGDGCCGIIVFLAQLPRGDGDGARALRKCAGYLATGGAAAAGYGYPTALSAQAGILTPAGAKLFALCRLASAGIADAGDMRAAIERLLDESMDAMRAADELAADYRHGVGGLLCAFAELEPLFSREELAARLTDILALADAKPLRASPPQTDTYRRYADRLLPDARAGAARIACYIETRWEALTTHPGYLKLLRALQTAPATAAAAVTDDSDTPLSAQPGEALLDRAYHLLDARDTAAAERVLAELVNRRRLSRRWFPDRWADDDFLPGAIHGRADMGLLLLSVADGKNLNPFRGGGGGDED